MNLSEADIQRFKRYYKEGPQDACWLWGGKADYGRGNFNADGKVHLAHRVAYCIANPGLDLKSTDMICHYCDSGLCVNPDHLYLGNARTNAYDRHKTGVWGQKEKPMSQVPPDEFKIQVRIPRDLYQQMLDLTEYNDQRIYGGLTKLVILALREYLAKYKVKSATDEEI